MEHWNTDKIIGAGLILALILLVIGNMIIGLFTGNYPPTDLPSNIASGLAGFMGRNLLDIHNKETDKK